MLGQTRFLGYHPSWNIYGQRYRRSRSRTSEFGTPSRATSEATVSTGSSLGLQGSSFAHYVMPINFFGVSSSEMSTTTVAYPKRKSTFCLLSRRQPEELASTDSASSESSQESYHLEAIRVLCRVSPVDVSSTFVSEGKGSSQDHRKALQSTPEQ